jgi:hypothetical protein
LDAFPIHPTIGDVVLEDGRDLEMVRILRLYGHVKVGNEHNAAETLASDSRAAEEPELTVGKYPSVKTLSREVFPHAPSPIMTNFLWQN